MPLLQRYILGELLRVFGFILSALTVLLVFVGVFKEISESGLGPLQVLQILPFIVPSLLPFTIPATLLLTVCVVYGRMAGDLEITAAKAAGINVLSLLWPAFGFGIVLSIGSFFLTDQVIPWAVANIQRTVTLAMEDIFLDMLRTQHQVRNMERGFTITVMDVDGKKLIMPTFQYTSKKSGSEPITVQAQEATLKFDLEEKVVHLYMTQGHIDIPGEQRCYFATLEKAFPLPKEIKDPKPRHMSIATMRNKQTEVIDHWEDTRNRRDVEMAFRLALGEYEELGKGTFGRYKNSLAKDQRDLHRLKTEMHTRVSMALSCLFFVFVGGPFAILQGKRQFLTSFFLCFMPILLLYYPIMFLTMNLCKSGTIDPTWSSWMANLLLFCWGSFVLWRVLRY